jgi:hypothetical protein
MQIQSHQYKEIHQNGNLYTGGIFHETLSRPIK